jgi:hypothetical protein
MKLLLAALLALSAYNANAALLIIDDTVGSDALIWRVGQPVPDIINYNYGDAMYCEAWGAELTYVQQHFQGMRMHTGSNVPNGNVVTWLDGDCEFIFNNL